MFRTRVLSVFGVFAALLLLVAGCAAGEGDPLAEGTDAATAGDAAEEETAGSESEAAADPAAGGPVVVGSTNFTEQLILANMYADVLEQAGYEVETRLNLGNREIVFPALESGEIDLVPEYIGALAAYLGEGAEEPGQDTEAVYQRLTESLPEGIVALEPSPAQDRNAFAVTQAFAEENNVSSLSDLANVEGTLTVGGPPELETRFDGLPGLQEVYGLENLEFRALDAGGPLTLSALESGQIDVGRVFSTQGTLAGRDLVVLEDDQNLVPAENLVPVIREEVLTDEIREALNEVSAALTEEDLIELNRRVDVDNQDPEVVAQEWLTEEGLLDG